MTEVNWGVEKIDGDVVLTAAGDDVEVYTMDVENAMYLADAIVEKALQEEDDSGQHPADDRGP